MADPMRILAILVLLLLPAAGAQTVLETHITLGATPQDVSFEPMRVSGLAIQWTTDAPYTPEDPPEVEATIDGSTSRIAAELVGEPLHGSVLSAVQAGTQYRQYVYGAIVPASPGTTIQYRVGSDGASFTDARNVTMPPADTLRVVATADIGYDGITNDEDPAPLRVRDLAMSLDADLTIIPGDLAYQDGNDGWTAWLQEMEPWLASVPVMPVPGNHESDRDYHQFKERFMLPVAAPATNFVGRVQGATADRSEEYYGFQAGPAYFVGVNSDGVCREDPLMALNDLQTDVPPCENGGTPDFDQYDWLHDILENAREELDPAWLIVYFHHPPYSWAAHGDDAAVKELWVPLFETYAVDLVITGHEHVYERTLPLIGGVPTQHGDEYESRKGVPYVVTGGGGRSLYEIKDPPYPIWWAAGQEAHHVSVFDITNETLSFQAIEADNGTIIDSFTITHGVAQEDAPPAGKGSPWPFGLVVVALAALWQRRHH